MNMKWLKSTHIVAMSMMVMVMVPYYVFATEIPQTINFQNIRVGQQFERSIIFVPSKKIEQEYFIEITGKGSQFIFTSGDRFTMSEGQEMTALHYTINTKNALVKTYQANLEIYILQENQQKEVTQEIPIIFTVTDQDVESFTIDKAQVSQSQEAVFSNRELSQRITSYFEIQNDGNVTSTLDTVTVYISKGKVDIDDIEKNDIAIEKQYQAENIDQAIAFSTKVNTLQIEHTLAIGEYTGVVVFTDDNQEIARLGNTFYIFPDNSGGMYVEILGVTVSDDTISTVDPLSVNVEVKNSGIVDVDPIIHIELYKDGELIEAKELKKESLQPQGLQNYLTAFNKQQKGEYILRTFATYGSIKTVEIEQSIFITTPTAGSLNGGMIFVVVLILIAIVFITALAGTSKKKKTKNNKKPYRFV